jgi:VCBS repeat-containing protein
MAYFPPFNGDAQPVFAMDINNGPQTGTISSDALVQMAGPKLDFFKIMVRDGSAAIDLRPQLGTYTSGVFTPGVVVQINQDIQKTATIAMYQVEGDALGQMSVGVYPSGAWTAGTLQASLQALGNVQITASNGTVTGVDVSGTLVTNPGFKLA